MPAPIRSLIAHFPEELGVARGPEPTDDPYMRRPEERREEIARMLSGAAITDEARAQAARVLEAA